MQAIDSDRRPLKVRSRQWVIRAARLLADHNITPNQISVASMVFATIGAATLLTGSTWGLVAAAACIQLRLVCNLLDGMVAVEHGRATALGAVYNEFPDRVADTVLLLAAGYACGTGWLGWAAALAAALTAYVRVFGAAVGLAQDFRGPMAKQHRMAVLTVACLVCALLPLEARVMTLRAALATIAALSAATCATRTRALCRALKDMRTIQ